ncbi:MAG: bacteriohemerythrin, partial [Treponemataceae bacterium]
WLGGDGAAALNNADECRAARIADERMHAQARRIVELRNQGKIREAATAFADFSSANEEVLSYIRRFSNIQSGRAEENELMPWKSNYAVGNISIDDQHRKLVGLLNRLHTTVAVGSEAKAAEKNLGDLADYAEFHFADEERMFSSSGYPDTAFHVRTHREFEKAIRSYSVDAAPGKVPLDEAAFLRMKDWFIDHFQTVDKGYVPCL